MNEKINWTPELLAECRNEKGVVLGMMSDAARMALRENREHAERFMSDGWMGRPSDESWHVDSKHYAYRISPSYVPPELEPKKWVDVPVGKNGTGMRLLTFNHPRESGVSRSIVEALKFSDFMCYVYADGGISMTPRNFHDNIAKAINGPAEAPVAVRFWTGR